MGVWARNRARCSVLWRQSAQCEKAMGHSIIYLIGFMGAGKTSVGRRLAALLRWEFLDLDDEIERGQGMSIRDLFQLRGEPYFRQLERSALERASRGQKAVVALGGGAFCDPENRRIIESTGTSVWLDAPIEILCARCEGDQSRPLFTVRAEMERLLEERRPHYAKAELRLDASGAGIDELADEILRRVRPR